MSDNGVVAWYGAVVSTIALGATVFSLWRDRPRVKVEGRIGWKLHNVPGLDPSKRYIVVTVINQGRRPCTIQMAGARMRKKQQTHLLLTGVGFVGPTELAESRSATWWCEQGDTKTDDIRDFFAIDNAGKRYAGRKRKQWISEPKEGA